MISTFSPILPESSPRSCSMSELVVLDEQLLQQADAAQNTSRACPGRSSRGCYPACRSPWPAPCRWTARTRPQSCGHVVAADIQRRRGGHVHGDIVGELHEVIGAGHEVGLATDLDQHADLAAGCGCSCRSGLHWCARPLRLAAWARPLVRSTLTASSKSPAALGQSLFAVHHAGAGLLPQFFYFFGANCHFPPHWIPFRPPGLLQPRLRGFFRTAAGRLSFGLGGRFGGAGFAPASGCSRRLFGRMRPFGLRPFPRACAAAAFQRPSGGFAAPLARRHLRSVSSCLPSMDGAAIALMISPHERMASSLPGDHKIDLIRDRSWCPPGRRSGCPACGLP